MALMIRLRPQGAKNRQNYRLVVCDEQSPLDGKYLEKLGSYDPLQEGANHLQIDVARVQHWLDLGAQISERACSLVEKFAPEVVKALVQKRVARTAKARAKRHAK